MTVSAVMSHESCNMTHAGLDRPKDPLGTVRETPELTSTTPPCPRGSPDAHPLSKCEVQCTRTTPSTQMARAVRTPAINTERER
jgi:hypothetical protein